MMDDSVVDDLISETISAQAGHNWESHTVTHGKELNLVDGSTHLKNLPPLVINVDDPYVLVSVGVNRTTDLGKSEMAKVGIRLSALVPRSERGELFSWLEDLANDMHAREMAGLKAQDQPSIDEFVNGLKWYQGTMPRMSLYMEYGLTLNLGDWQFDKPSVGVNETFNPDDFAVIWKDISNFLGARIQKAVAKARAPKSAAPAGL